MPKQTVSRLQLPSVQLP